MAISGTIPVIWGLATSRANEAVWIALSAEAVSWVELKGPFQWRVRTLLTGALFTMVFSVIGMVTGVNLIFTILGMFGVAFLATILKNVGDRASGLAICVYMMFIFSNANPDNKLFDIKFRLWYVAIGAMLAVFTGIIVSLLTPAQQPYRRQIALIFRAIASLVKTISGNRYTLQSGKPPEDLYEKEKEVRLAMDNSLKFFDKLAHQVNTKDHQHYQLAQVRKAASLVAVNIIAITDEMEHIVLADLDESLRLKAAAMYGALQEAIDRIAVYVISLKPEEKLIAISQLNRVKKLSMLIKNFPFPVDERQRKARHRILHLVGRSVILLESAIGRIDNMGKDKPVLRSYSLIKTSFVLKPRYFFRNIRSMFSLSALTTRYALRSAIAATIAMAIYKYFNIDHGYWLPFSVMIIIQPYFGATFKKAMDRVVGTLLGGISGSLLLHIPGGLHIKELILFATFVIMVYYMRKNYAIAVFAVTLNLVLLFNIEVAGININSIMFTRAICTTGGAVLAVIAGFALLPAWDKKWLPVHLANAVRSNYDYFMATFYKHGIRSGWTKFKKLAESNNSDVFDSFNRYKDEPGKDKSMTYYDLIACNVRITRDLNNVNTEFEERNSNSGQLPAYQQKKIAECWLLFQETFKSLEAWKTGVEIPAGDGTEFKEADFYLNDAQLISLEKIMIELKTMLLLLHT